MIFCGMTPLFAEFEFEDIAFSWRKVSPATREGLVVFGALILITILLLIWAAFLRRRGGPRPPSRRRKHGSKETASQPIARANAGTGNTGQVSSAPQSGPVKPRRRRRALPTNPTLAQTGGLPPIRSEDPSQTSS
jgi:hypothetical protein